MTPTETDLATLWAERPFFLVYLGLLIVAALGGFALGLNRFRPTGARPWPGVSAWRIKPTDFGLFLCALVLWFTLSSLVVFQVAEAWLGPDRAREHVGVAIVAGGLLQVGLATIFLLTRQSTRTPAERRLDLCALSLPRAGGLGLLGWLTALPPVYGVMAAWMGLLLFFQALGLPISLEDQAAVQVFRAIDAWPWFLAMIALAVVVAPIAEELVFRAGLYRYLRGAVGRTAAVVLSSMAFGLIHFSLVGFPSLMLVGVACCLVYEATGNLKVPIFLHAAFNGNQVILMVLSGLVELP